MAMIGGGVEWHRMASDGGGWCRVTLQGTDVESPSGVSAELYQRTVWQFV